MQCGAALAVTCGQCRTELPAAAAFCFACGQAVAGPSSAAPTAVTAPTPVAARVALDGERRDVTVLFADVSGFTAMCEKLDPEDVQAVMNECFSGLGQAIQEEDGYIDKYIGDNVMALFGAPMAHEDDPARACRAALAMQTFLQGFAERCRPRTGIAIRMRIGVHCGLVLAGEVGSNVRSEYSVMGDAVNVASRLESAAPPGGILVSAEVARRCRGRFEFSPSRQLTLKGKAAAVEAFELLRELTVLDPRGRDGLSVAVVGRADDLAALLGRWGHASPEHRWIEVRGEIGIGKTRLVEEAARQRPGRRLLTVGVTANASRRAFGLVRRVLLALVSEVSGQATGLETPEAFRLALAQLGPSVVPFGDALWHVTRSGPATEPPPDPDPQTLRGTIERGVTTLLAEVARGAPDLTLALDSYELADPASATLLESLRQRPEDLSLSMIVTARDDGRRPLKPEAVIRVGPLTDAEARELLDRVTRGAALPDALRRDILERAGGVPLFIEEMVRSLLDQGLLSASPDGVWRWVAQGEPDAATLPASIRGAMVARLDRLERPARDLLRQLAVQGVEFDLDVADAVARALDREGSPVAAVVDQLERLDVVARIERDQPRRYAFCQPLLQEACYETILVRERRTLHAQTAQALCTVGGGAEFVSPALLAHHYERAERWAEAAAANLRAGDYAAGLFLNDEAMARYRRALETDERLTERPDPDRRTAALAHAGMARVELRVGDYPAAEGHAREMETLASRTEDRVEAERLLASACAYTGRTEEARTLLLEGVATARADSAGRAAVAHALYDLAELNYREGRTREALARLEECRELLSARERLLALRADMLEGVIAHSEGRFADAAALYRRANEQAESLGSLSERARAANHMGNVARDLGDYDASQQHFRQALEIWERTGNTECIAGAHNNLGNLAISRADFPTARAHHAWSLAACRKIGNVHGSALALANLAILAVEEGDGPGAVASAEAALETLGDSGNVVLRALVCVALGEAQLASGRVAEARATFDGVLREYPEATHPLAVAGARRGLGRVALAEGRAADAVGLLGHAQEALERLNRAQEAARTALYRAEALARAGQVALARVELERARARLVAMRAEQDAGRADRLLRDLEGGWTLTGS